MSWINVLVVAVAPPDVVAKGIAAKVAACSDMMLVENRILDPGEAEALLTTTHPPAPCALVLVGTQEDTEAPAERWFVRRPDLVVLQVALDDVVRITLQGLGLSELIDQLRDLVDRDGATPRDRVAKFPPRPYPTRVSALSVRLERPLLAAATRWVHQVLSDAVVRHGTGHGDLPGLTVTTTTVKASLDRGTAGLTTAPEVADADAALVRALAATDTYDDPLATAMRVCGLGALEFRILLLALSPELDLRYQRSLGLLLDDLGRRAGNLALYAGLLGKPPEVRRELAHAGRLTRWRLLEARPGGLPPADESFRIDPYIGGWLLGEREALSYDPRVRRALHTVRWPGFNLIELDLDRARAGSITAKLQAVGEAQWLIFAGDDASGWRALLELGAEQQRTPLLRLDAARLVGLDSTEIEEAGLRFGRCALLGAQPLVVDITGLDNGSGDDDLLRLLFAAIGGTGARAGLVCTEAPRAVRLLGSAPFAMIDGTASRPAGRAAMVRAASKALDVPLS